LLDEVGQLEDGEIIDLRDEFGKGHDVSRLLK
jgi:hypothetical protein